MQANPRFPANRSPWKGTLSARHDPRLEPIAAKVMAGERLDFDDGLALYGVGGRSGRGLAGQPRARADARRRDLLQREPAHQSDQCVRGGVQAVRVWAQEGRPGRLHDGSGRGVGDGGLGLLGSGDGVSHCWRAAPGPAVRIFSRSGARAEGSAFPRCTSRPSPWWRWRTWRGGPS